MRWRPSPASCPSRCRTRRRRLCRSLGPPPHDDSRRYVHRPLHAGSPHFFISASHGCGTSTCCWPAARRLGLSHPGHAGPVPMLAPASQLTRIAGINQIISSVSDIAGPALGALMLALTSIGNILLLDVAGAAAACISMLCVRIPNPRAKRASKTASAANSAKGSPRCTPFREWEAFHAGHRRMVLHHARRRALPCS